MESLSQFLEREIHDGYSYPPNRRIPGEESTERSDATRASYIGWSQIPRGDMKSLAFKILPPRSI